MTDNAKLQGLRTLADVVRWGTARLRQSKVLVGHSEDNALDEARSLVLHALHEYHLDDAWGINVDVPIWLSLTVIIATLAITTVASLIKSRHDLRKEAEYHQPPQ